MKKCCLVVICLLAFVYADWKAESFSGEYTTKPYWADSAKYKDGKYQGGIIANCKISALGGKGFVGMKEYLMKWFEEQSKDKKWTTVKDYFTMKKDGKMQKLDAIRISYVNIDKSDTGSLEMELEAYIGYEPGYVLMVESVSKKVISASGDKERLKEFKSFYRYNKADEKGYYNIYCWRYYSLEGYWYEPTSLFIKGVRTKALKSFTEAIDKWMTTWAENL